MNSPCACFIVAAALSPLASADEYEVVLPVLHANAHMVRDEKGVPHLFASNEHDLLLTQGYMHANDRLFQMDYFRRLPSGRLAELLGAAALPSDVQFRTLGVRRAAERSLAALSPKTVAGLQAYAEGVNLWVESHPLPIEYAALELTQFEPWSTLDSVTVGRLFSFLFSFEVDADATVAFLTYVETGAFFGFDGAALYFEDVYRCAGFDAAATIPDAGGSVAGPALPPSGPGSRCDPTRAGTAMPRLAAGWVEKLRRIEFFRGVLDYEWRAGSNEWAISGTLTTSGRPLLGNDPHLNLNAQSTFLPIHLTGGGFNVTGDGFAGVPYVVLGHNEHLAWGATNHLVDVTDTFAEQLVPDPASPSGFSSVYLGQLEPVIPISESYRQNEPFDGIADKLTDVPPGPDVPPFTLIIPRRNLGPIVALDPASGAALSIQWIGYSATREFDAIRALDRARDFDEFRDALRFWDVGSENFVVADVAGNIAYLTSGEIPLREDLAQATVTGLPPFFIRDGTGGNEWISESKPGRFRASPYRLLDVDLMPHLVNPPNGWFVNANNDPTGFSRDNDPLNKLTPDGGILYLNYGFDTGLRAGRIQELLTAKVAQGPVSLADVEAIQADTGLRDAEYFVPWIDAALTRAQSGSVDPTLAALGADPGVIEAVARLSDWDFTTPTGVDEGYDASDVDGVLLPSSQSEIDASVAASIYSVWRGRILESTIDATLAQFGMPSVDADGALAGLRHLLESFATRAGLGHSGLDFFVVPGVADPADERDILLLASVRAALDLLAGPSFDAAFKQSKHQDDYRWGRLHRIVFTHWLGGPFDVPPAGGAFPDPFPDLIGIPYDGGYATIDAAYHNARGNHSDAFLSASGPVRRFACQLDPDRPRAFSSLPGGTSGALGDPNYIALLPAWLTNDSYTVWLAKDEARSAGVHTWNFRTH